MSTSDLKVLVGRLDPVARQALAAAAGDAFGKTHYEIEIEHWLLALLALPGAAFGRDAAGLGIDVDRLRHCLERGLHRCRSGCGQAPVFSPRIVTLLRQSWLLASLHYGAAEVSALHLLAALTRPDGDTQLFADLPLPLERLDNAALDRAIRDASALPAPAPPTDTRTPDLDAYTIDLTGEALAGRIDPVLGRDPEVRQTIDILTRRRQNNPILVGEAGVGKTAIVEALALRIAAGEVPAAMRALSIRTLDLGLLQAGAGVKGEFENRLKRVIDEVKGSPTPIVLFIDEAHTLIGAGGQPGQGDAANLLKPDLARGQLRVIAATTWAEYKRHIEPDAALTRRFQPVKVDEPGEEAAIAMMRGLVGTLEAHHGVSITDEAVRASVRLSKRYIAGRQLPDKCVSLLDTSAAMVAMSRDGRPEALEDVIEAIRRDETERAHLEREAGLGVDHGTALAALRERLQAAGARRAALEARWEREKGLVEEIATLRADIGRGADTAGMARLRTRHAALALELAGVQGETPLVFDRVSAETVARVVARWTGIPVGRMLVSDLEATLALEDRLKARVIGQDGAIARIADMVQAARAGLNDPAKPPAVFLLVGPSGVGKTETALALADTIYGGEQSLTVINMSEFKEEHKVSLLLGAPPGYVGYGEGGLLTEAVRRRPYGVLLLDEMEKAHPGVQDIFYQLFDKGVLRDSEGRDVDFRNTTIVMASTAGAGRLGDAVEADPSVGLDDLAQILHEELLRSFKAAFLGRVSVIPYLPLTVSDLTAVAGLKLDRLRRRLVAEHGAALSVNPLAIDQLVQCCGSGDIGARAIDDLLARIVLPTLSRQILDRMAAGRPIGNAVIDWDAGEGEFRIGLQDPPAPADASGPAAPDPATGQTGSMIDA
ncbi:MAG: type VI secretion system ATPase TssH [Telmatospirillum sp.]|nr:type VI secretion system ATPase TssH [Telmatospirillum sp.]